MCTATFLFFGYFIDKLGARSFPERLALNISFLLNPQTLGDLLHHLQNLPVPYNINIIIHHSPLTALNKTSHRPLESFCTARYLQHGRLP